MTLNIKQPGMPFVNLKIGDFNITPEIPKFLQSFTYRRKTNSSANDFDFKVFDETAMKIERAIAEGYEQVSFSYGWAGGSRSKEYLGRILDYDLNFNSMGAELSISGVSEIMAAYMGDERKKKYVKDDGTAMRIHEIIKDIADYEGWEVGKLEETKPVEDKEEKGEEKIFIQDEDETSIEFIKNKLLERAESKKSDDGDYRLWFDDSNGSITINFSPVNFKEEPDESYVYNLNTRDTNVISFSPDFSGKLMMQKGSSKKIVTKFPESISNDLKSIIREKDSGKVHAEGKTYEKEGVYHAQRSAGYEGEVKRIQNYIRSHAVNQSYSADLEIFGNPETEVFKTISVIVITRKGELHHTSGLYMITEIEDSIDSGRFTTKYTLKRDSSKTGKDDVEGDVSGKPNSRY